MKKITKLCLLAFALTGCSNLNANSSLSAENTSSINSISNSVESKTNSNSSTEANSNSKDNSSSRPSSSSNSAPSTSSSNKKPSSNSQASSNSSIASSSVQPKDYTINEEEYLEAVNIRLQNLTLDFHFTESDRPDNETYGKMEFIGNYQAHQYEMYGWSERFFVYYDDVLYDIGINKDNQTASAREQIPEHLTDDVGVTMMVSNIPYAALKNGYDEKTHNYIGEFSGFNINYHFENKKLVSGVISNTNYIIEFTLSKYGETSFELPSWIDLSKICSPDPGPVLNLTVNEEEYNTALNLRELNCTLRYILIDPNNNEGTFQGEMEFLGNGEAHRYATVIESEAYYVNYEGGFYSINVDQETQTYRTYKTNLEYVDDSIHLTDMLSLIPFSTFEDGFDTEIHAYKGNFAGNDIILTFNNKKLVSGMLSNSRYSVMFEIDRYQETSYELPSWLNLADAIANVVVYE